MHDAFDLRIGPGVSSTARAVLMYCWQGLTLATAVPAAEGSQHQQFCAAERGPSTPAVHTASSNVSSSGRWFAARASYASIQQAPEKWPPGL